MPRIKDAEQRRKIRRLIEEGKTNKEIADSLGVSAPRISVIKKELFPASSDTERHNTFISDHHITVPKFYQDLGISDPYFYWQISHGDEEEGWRMRVDEGQEIIDTFAVFWACIAYFASEAEADQVMHGLEAQGLVCEYIWHDLDFWDHDSPQEELDIGGTKIIIPEGAKHRRGDAKTPHCHVIMQFEKSRSWKEAQRITKGYFGDAATIAIAVKNPSSMHDYLIHATQSAREAGKHLYPEEKRKQIGSFSLELTRAQKAAISSAIMHWILTRMYEECGAYEYHLLEEHFDGQPMEQMVIKSDHARFADTITSLRNHLGLDLMRVTDEVLEREIDRVSEYLKRAKAEQKRRRDKEMKGRYDE